MRRAGGRVYDLRIHIRLALLSLGRDPHQYDKKKLKISELENILKGLRAEQRSAT